MASSINQADRPDYLASIALLARQSNVSSWGNAKNFISRNTTSAYCNYAARDNGKPAATISEANGIFDHARA
jgi:hypothetical protein